MKPAAVVRLDEVTQLVQQHVVTHPSGKTGHPRRQPDLSGPDGARAPAVILVGDPSHAAGTYPALHDWIKIAPGQSVGSLHELLVSGGSVPATSVEQCGDEFVHPAPLLVGVHAPRNHDEDMVAVLAGRQGAMPLLATSDDHCRTGRGRGEEGLCHTFMMAHAAPGSLHPTTCPTPVTPTSVTQCGA